MSTFIPKKTLTEGMASNPLDAVQTVSNDITKKAQEGILTAAAAETDAINQYEQILDLVNSSEPWLGNMVKPTLEDIISEEKKHFAQLSTVISKLPAFEEEFKAGAEEAETGEDKEEPKEETENKSEEEEKEEVKEEVQELPEVTEYSLFNVGIVRKIIREECSNPEQLQSGFDKLEDLQQFDNEDNEDVTAFVIDCALYPFNFDPEVLARVENRIVKEAYVGEDTERKAKDEGRDNIAMRDADTLEALINNNTLIGDDAISAIQTVIKFLRDRAYLGNEIRIANDFDYL